MSLCPLPACCRLPPAACPTLPPVSGLCAVPAPPLPMHCRLAGGCASVRVQPQPGAAQNQHRGVAPNARAAAQPGEQAGMTARAICAAPARLTHTSDCSASQTLPRHSLTCPALYPLFHRLLLAHPCFLSSPITHHPPACTTQAALLISQAPTHHRSSLSNVPFPSLLIV